MVSRFSSKMTVVAVVFSAILLTSCKWIGGAMEEPFTIDRFDRHEARYILTGDFSALQEMTTNHTTETRVLIEDVLGLGKVADGNISNAFLSYFQDPLLQMMVKDVQEEYSDIDDLTGQLDESFSKMEDHIDGFRRPHIYTQISSLEYGVTVYLDHVGVSLDMYLGADYPLYRKLFPANKRKTMERSFIAVDVIETYLGSLYPVKATYTQYEKDLHVAKIVWVTSQSTGKPFAEFSDINPKLVSKVDEYMKSHPSKDWGRLLNDKGLV